MAETKSVIDIEIKDDKFRAFVGMFNKYKESLGKMPGQWGEIGKEADRVNGSLDGIQHAVDSIAKKLDDSYEPLKKIDKQAKQTQKTFKAIGSEIKYAGARFNEILGAGRAFASLSFSIAKWSALSLGGSLIGAGAGLFGMKSLSESMIGTRSQAMGLGMTPGELRAAESIYGKYHDIGSLTSSISSAQTDVEKQKGFLYTGISNPQDKTVGEMLPQILKKAGEVAKTTPTQNLAEALKAYGLSDLGITPEIARRESKITDKEREDRDALYRQNTEQLNQNDKTLLSWQKLLTQLDLAGENIKKVLGDTLVPLTGPLKELSDAFTEAVKAFLSNPKLKEWIGDFGDKIREFGDWLKNADLKQTFTDFFDKVQYFSDSLMDLADYIQDFLGNKHFEKQHEKQEKQKEEYRTLYDKGNFAERAWALANLPKEEVSLLGKKDLLAKGQKFMDFFVNKGRSKEEAAAMVGNIMQESGMNPQVWNPEKTHFGLAQWSKDWRKRLVEQFGDKFGKDITKWTEDQQLEAYDWSSHQDRAGRELARAKNLEEKNRAIFKYFEAPGDNTENKRKNFGAAFLHQYNVSETTKQELKDKVEKSSSGDQKAPEKVSSAMPSWNIGTPTQVAFDMNINKIPGMDIAVNARQLQPYFGYGNA